MHRLHLSLAPALLLLVACTDRATSIRPTALRLSTLVAGNLFTCGTEPDGALWCWGSNSYGQLGVGDREDRTRPVRVPLPAPVAQLSAGYERVCAVLTNGTVSCWGENTEFVPGDSARPLYTRPVTLDVGPVRQVATGVRATCITDSARYASCWGGNRHGELGTGDDTLRIRMSPARVAAPMPFDTIVVGRDHACGLTADGAAWCWGGAGLTGDGSRVTRPTPVLVAGAHRFVSLTIAQSVTCGIDDRQAAWCWGLAYDGQLGAGAPLDNPFVPVAVKGGRRFRQLAAGYHRVCGLDTDGRAWCWGSNFNGVLGDTGRVSSPEPVPVHGSRRYRFIASGDLHACAIDQVGETWCWGQNRIGDGGGALGDGTIIDRALPTLIAPSQRVQ
jgi:alpha-tubulin suppressor-like RCC1 family protein